MQFKPAAGHILVAPSLLSANFGELGAEVKRVEKAGCEWLHLDIMDHHFVPNLTFGPPVVKALRKYSKKLVFDAHLMVTNPLPLVDDFVECGVESLTLHEEACDDLPRALKTVREAGMRVGVSIKPDTPVSTIEDVLSMVNLVLVMTVEPGFGGQALIPSCINKIRQLKRLREQKKLSFLIEVDGGVNIETADIVVAAGADVLVAGSAIFKDGKIAENAAALRASIHKNG